MQNPLLYAKLACTSNISFLAGASHPQELVARAADLGYSAIAITDDCSLAGVVRALEEAQRCAQRGRPIQLIPGSSLRLANGSRLLLLPEDHAGYTAICTLITRGRRNAPKGEYALPDASFEHGPGHGLARCLALWLPATNDKGGDESEHDMNTAYWQAAYFPGRCWLGASLSLGPVDARRLLSPRPQSGHPHRPHLQHLRSAHGPGGWARASQPVEAGAPRPASDSLR